MQLAVCLAHADSIRSWNPGLRPDQSRPRSLRSRRSGVGCELSAWRLPASRLSEIRDRLSDNERPPTGRVGQHRDRSQLAPPRAKPGAALVSARGDRGVARSRRSRRDRAADRHGQDDHRDRCDVGARRRDVDRWCRRACCSISGRARWTRSGARRSGGSATAICRIEAITVATYASAVAWAPRIGDQFGLVIVDEAHHVGAWCPADVLRHDDRAGAARAHGDATRRRRCARARDRTGRLHARDRGARRRCARRVRSRDRPDPPHARRARDLSHARAASSTSRTRGSSAHPTARAGASS